MIDIHCHMLFGVDDGPETIEESIQMLREASYQNIDQIILTPHYREGMFSYPVDKILKNYNALCKEAEWLGIELHLGTEYHVDELIIDNLARKRVRPLAGGNYVLSEFSHHSEFSYIYKMVKDIIQHGYIPVIAHVERIPCLHEDLMNIKKLRDQGALIQINAPAVIGKYGSAAKKICKKLLENILVDVIASDAHGIKQRELYMKDCYQYVGKKYAPAYADKLMVRNPEKILLGK